MHLPPRTIGRAPRTFVGCSVVVALTLTFGACASSTSVSTAADSPAANAADGLTDDDATADQTVSATPTDAVEQDPTAADVGDVATPDDVDGDDVPVAVGESRIIGRANIGGEVVSPTPHEINDLVVMESFPEQLGFSFMAGDASCLAADATATATDDQVIVELLVGITTDAMTRSCLAGSFEHRMTIALEEGLLGREVVFAPVATQGSEPIADEPPPQPFESTLIGMSAESAKEAAESFGYIWRVMALDGEQFVGTLDMLDNRVNVAIENGVVVDAWAG